ncbi:type I restriction endonuclease subunit R [Weissella soli]|uniref:type I restriction endonuclease subunit R n=1 Tax=Weissella soli TaxID=155866 RepID=UPI001F1C6A39|nr:type I restriction endonuclease subunit R [Weissella soli]GJM47972.1 type I restriction enzyme R protein [Weissella soli]
MAEDKFEQAVIQQLKNEGWDYLSDYSGVTVDKLYDHWRDILNENNARRLDGTPLTDSEFEQVKLELDKNKTPYDAQLMLAGAGGVGTVPLHRDDGSQLELEIFYGDEVAGGHSRYEVVNQITFNNLTLSLSSKRRVDVILLINGLPVAHVEEKDESLQNQWNAFEQLQKYAGDGMYTGLFSFVQVQFILAQHSAHYFARPKDVQAYNRDFVFGWRDDQGKDVSNAMTFIHEVMGIPALHRLVTVNMIPDASNDSLMVMRSYQIQATRKILDRMREMNQNDMIEKEGGYVWHTTGSGKTVTSFKVAQLLASAPRVQDVLFIVDRVDLVNQTYENFKSYAYKTFEDRIKIVNGHELKHELKHNQTSHIYLITIQGLDRAIKAGLTSRNRMVILMDEAHRSASGDAVARIKKGLPRTTWFGFTGTPNFYSDEINEVKTSKNISTFDIFGPRLHRYTIKDAIGDGNVLGFDVTYYESTFEMDNVERLSESELEKEVYMSLPFRQAVVEDIKANWDKNASGPIEMGVRKPNQFQGILAVSGKQAVAAYYSLFKQIAPELRVAMTYSRDEDNGTGASDLQQALKQAMQDYISFYGTHNFLEDQDSERTYLNDITKRIARKKPYNQDNDADRLDLIIVSDQLLTGFDSKYVNIIYMDKIMAEGPLIQAMSRTNRTISKNAKPYGKIRFYRKGEVMEENVKNALVIYTKGGNDVITDSTKIPDETEQEELFDDGILAPKMADQISTLNPMISRLQELAGDDFSQVPRSEKEKLEFAVTAAEVNAKIQRLTQQGYVLGSETADSTGESVTLSITDKNQLSTLQARLNDVNELLPPEKRVDLTNIKVAIQSFASEIIDYDLLVSLLNDYMDDITDAKREAVEEHVKPLDQANREEIEAVLDGIENGDYQAHFDTETLKTVRKTIRSEQQELKIYKWAADHNYNGNEILKAYNLYLPNIALVDNSKLNDQLQEIENKLEIGFFETAEFEESLLTYFKEITKGK